MRVAKEVLGQDCFGVVAESDDASYCKTKGTDRDKLEVMLAHSLI